jgi:hypothetical protein
VFPCTICCTLTAVPRSSGGLHSPLADPRVEHGADRLRELLARLSREVEERLEALGQLAQGSGVEPVVEGHAALIAAARSQTGGRRVVEQHHTHTRGHGL